MIAELVLESPEGATVKLRITTLHGQESWNGIDRLEVDTSDADGVSSTQLLEESEYDFLLGGESEIERIEPTELFSASSNASTFGRIKTRGRTGIVRVDVYLASGAVASGEIEVRARKLNYRTEYRWMLERIADEAAELALSPFAASRF